MIRRPAIETLGKRRMRKLIAPNLVSVDGFFEGPNKELDWHVVEEEFHEYAKDMLRKADTLLFGADTYEVMVAYWPTAAPGEIADRMNNLSKIVFSRTLKKSEMENFTSKYRHSRRSFPIEAIARKRHFGIGQRQAGLIPPAVGAGR
jgi:hypothetical protein